MAIVNRDTLFNLYWEKNLSANQIAKIVKISPSHVKRLMEKYKIKRRSATECHLIGKKKATREELQKLYYDDGLSTVEIGNKFNVHNKTVGRWMEEQGIQRRELSESKFKLKISKEELTDLYVNKKLSTNKIARMFNMRTEYVRRKLIFYNISRRKFEDAFKLYWCSDSSKKLRDEVSKRFTKLWKNKEYRDKLVQIKIEKWKDPKFAKMMFKSFNIRPNKPEQKLIDIIKKHNLPYKYVGDGQFILGRKCPDFINCNGEKKVIELFGDYWHNPKRKKIAYHRTYEGTMEHYKKYGFECLIIWERELNTLSEEEILKTINVA